MDNPRILIVSHVHPFPGSSGQQRRVFYTLQALRDYFKVTFLTSVPKAEEGRFKSKILEYCDDAIVLEAKSSKNILMKVFYALLGRLFSVKTGLKPSNYIIGNVDFSIQQMENHMAEPRWDCVIYEYWHAVNSTQIFNVRDIPCILDTHNILWRSLVQQYGAQKIIPKWWMNRRIEKYKMQEEAAWNRFDGIIAINEDECDYIKKKVPSDKRVFYTPMGIDLDEWPFSIQATTPQRVVYYGGLGSPHNQKNALFCCREVMPIIWETMPDIEFWVVGSNPPREIWNLPNKDRRIHVTGFVPVVQEILKTMSLMLCPWSGTYGFRSRVIELMALGIPVIATPDAVYGMGLEPVKGIFLENSGQGMADTALKLLSDHNFLRQQSELARKQVEERFSMKVTYKALAHDLYDFIENWKVDHL